MDLANTITMLWNCIPLGLARLEKLPDASASSDLPTIIGLLIIFLQGIVNFLSWRKSTQAAHLTGAVEAMKTELEVYRDKTDRLDKEVKIIKQEEVDCRRQLERVTKWYLRAKGDEEDEKQNERQRPGR